MIRFAFALLILTSFSTVANAQLFPRFNNYPTYPQQSYRPVYKAPYTVPPNIAPTCPTCPVVTTPAVVKPVPVSPAPNFPPEDREASDSPVRDVPNVAMWEVLRRGNMVQQLGQPSADEADAVAEALSIPPDDSFKWFITVVTCENCRYCDKLKYDFINSQELRAWVLVDDPSHSTCHYQVRRIEDQTQRDWFAGIDQEIRRGGFPAIVIQPPKNGQYGPNKTVVSILHGYGGNPKALSDKMTAAITRYITSLHRKGLIRGSVTKLGVPTVTTEEEGIDLPFWKNGDALAAMDTTPPSEPTAPVLGGYGQEETGGTIGGPPPYVVPPKPLNPVQPVGPVVDFPPPATPLTPVGPVPGSVLTVAQIKELVPGAPAAFILEQHNLKPTDPDAVKVAWEVFREEHGIPDPNLPAVQPVAGFWTAFVAHLSGQLPTMLILALIAFRGFITSSKVSPLLSETQFQALLDSLNATKKAS